MHKLHFAIQKLRMKNNPRNISIGTKGGFQLKHKNKSRKSQETVLLAYLHVNFLISIQSFVFYEIIKFHSCPSTYVGTWNLFSNLNFSKKNVFTTNFCKLCYILNMYMQDFRLISAHKSLKVLFWSFFDSFHVPVPSVWVV